MHAYYVAHKERWRRYNRKWRKANPTKVRAIAERYRAKESNKEKLRRGKWRRKGMQMPTRRRPGICELCSAKPKGRVLCADHDHKTGRFRGWLCTHCNYHVVAPFRDSPHVLVTRLQRYIRKM